MKIFKGKKYEFIHTRDVYLDDIRAVFFPKSFREKYLYLGSIPNSGQMDMLKALVIVMDYAAKPWWCPRWFLRFLHLFGSDNSIVRVRNRRLHDLGKRLTNGIMMVDYKTKWEWYDLRISVHGPKYIQDLADAIEFLTYRRGRKSDLVGRIKEIQPDFSREWLSIDELEEHLEQIKHKKEDE